MFVISYAEAFKVVGIGTGVQVVGMKSISTQVQVKADISNTLELENELFEMC